MRLTIQQIQAICNNANKYFGNDCQIWLFGSRVNDKAKGGDIDLYIESAILPISSLITGKLYFLRDLHLQIGEQKIDLVLRRCDSGVDLPIYTIAKQTGVQLQ